MSSALFLANLRRPYCLQVGRLFFRITLIDDAQFVGKVQKNRQQLNSELCNFCIKKASESLSSSCKSTWQTYSMFKLICSIFGYAAIFCSHRQFKGTGSTYLFNRRKNATRYKAVSKLYKKYPNSWIPWISPPQQTNPSWLREWLSCTTIVEGTSYKEILNHDTYNWAINYSDAEWVMQICATRYVKWYTTI